MIVFSRSKAGKSTIAVCLSAEWHNRGLRVLLVDADPQATALTWAEVAAESELESPTVIAMGDNLRQQLPRAAEGYDVVVIDCPGRKSSKRQIGALMLADFALLPCGPSTPDVWALSESTALVDEVRELRWIGLIRTRNGLMERYTGTDSTSPGCGKKSTGGLQQCVYESQR